MGMKSLLKRSDLPNLPGDDTKTTNKDHPTPSVTDPVPEKKSDIVDLDQTNSEKKTRFLNFKSKNGIPNDENGFSTDPDHEYSSGPRSLSSRPRASIDHEYSSGPRQFVNRTRPSVEHEFSSGPRPLSSRTRASVDHEYSSGFRPISNRARFSIDHEYSSGPRQIVNRTRPSVEHELNQTRPSIENEETCIVVKTESHSSVFNSSLNRRRPSISPDHVDLGTLDSLLGQSANGSHRGGRRRSLALNDVPDVLQVKEASKSRRDTDLAVISNDLLNELSSSLLTTDEKVIHEKKRQPSFLKEATGMINMPQRILPGAMMEKYIKRTTKSEKVISLTEPGKEFTPSQEALIESESLSKDEDEDSKIPEVSISKRRWKRAICYTIVGLRCFRLYDEIRQKGMNVQRAKALEAEGLSVLLSAANISKGDPSISARIKELTSKEDRSDEDIEALERILSIKNRAFGRFSLDQRLKFCKIVQYEHYKGERIIVKEGHVSWAFYFILSGQAEIFKVKDNLKYRLNVIGAGTSFGDRTMNMLNDKRTASVASTMDIELLKIDKTDFFDITNVRDEKGISNRSAKILQVPHFATAPLGFIERIAPFVQVITYEPNEYILNEGVENNKIFWLIKGTLQCIKMLPFTKKTVNETYGAKTVQVSPYETGKSGLDAGEEFFYEFAITHEVELGGNFVDLPVPTGGSLTEHCFYVNNRDYLEQLKNEDPSDLNSKAGVSIVAKTKVEALCINRVDYIRLATNDMILSIINTKDIYRIPIAQLQESYLNTRKWNAYKKKVVADVVSKDKPR